MLNLVVQRYLDRVWARDLNNKVDDSYALPSGLYTTSVEYFRHNPAALRGCTHLFLCRYQPCEDIRMYSESANLEQKDSRDVC